MTLTDNCLSPTLPDINSITLSNGLKCILVPNESNPVLCLQIYIKTGSVKEKSGQHGYSHFLEHLCFKATDEYPANSISRFASSLGGMLNAYTDYDCTCYYILLPSDQISSGLHILSQLVMHPSLLSDDVESEKDIIIEEIKQYENEPEQDFIEYIQVKHFETSPLKRPVLGTVRSIRQATAKKIAKFYTDHYHPGNAFIVVSGDFPLVEIEHLIDKHFGAWKGTTREIENQITDLEPELPMAKIMFRKKNMGEEFLAITFPELCEAHPLSDAMLVAMRYFAIGKSSRLFKRLVEQEKLCSSIKVSSLSGLLSGVSVVLLCPIGNKSYSKIMDVIRDEYQCLMQYGIPQEELVMVQKDIIHNWIYGFEGVENTANQIAAEEFIGNLASFQQYCANINKINNEDVCNAISRYWAPTNISIYHQGSSALMQVSEFCISIGGANSSAKCHVAPLNVELPPLGSNQQCPTDKLSDIIEIDEDYYYAELSGGMKLHYKKLPKSSVSGFALSSHISQLCETPQQRGTNFFCSTLLLYGTEYHTHEQLMRFSREHGFNIRVVHHLDSTTFRGKCLKDNLEKSLATLAEVIHYPKFDADHLKLLKASALDGIRRDNDYPVSYAYQKWFQMLVGRNSNLFRSTGNASDIRAISLKDVRAWYHAWNVNRDFCLGIVSSHEPHQVVEICEKYFHKAPHRVSSLVSRAQWEPSVNRCVKQHRETDQAIIHLGGFASTAHKRDENAAFHVLSHILGGDISSRFFEIIREQNGIAYQTGFDFTSIKELGFWNGYAFCDPQNSSQCIAIIKNILNDVCTIGIEESELTDAIRYLICMNKFDGESVSYTASSMSSLAALGYEPDYYIKREERLMAVNIETINRVAAEAFRADNQYLHILV